MSQGKEETLGAHRKSIVKETIDRLEEKMAIDQSHYEAKKAIREEQSKAWSVSDGKIHSFKIQSMYQEHSIRFVKWAHFLNRTEQPLEAQQAWYMQYTDLHDAELVNIPGMHHVQARGVTLTTLSGPQDVTLDGEIRGQTPMDVQMAAESLRVVSLTHEPFVQEPETDLNTVANAKGKDQRPATYRPTQTNA